MAAPSDRPPTPWRWVQALLLVPLALLLAGCPQPAAGPVERGAAVRVSGGIATVAVGLCALPGQVVVRTRAGGHLQVRKQGREVRLVPLTACPPEPPAVPGMLEGGGMGKGSQTVNAAWLAGPTRRYGHNILGNAPEASELHIITPGGGRHRFALDAESVFEDLRPRVVDIDGDGQEEILLVRSRLAAGSSVLLLGVVRGELRVVAESAPIGRRHRWLNPVGVADFDNDGRREIAVVTTPHIGGTLLLLQRQGERLVPKYTVPGFSNHAIGSRELGMSAVLDFNGDHVPDLAIPGDGRRSLRIVTFAGGRFTDLHHFRYEEEIVTAVAKANFDTQIEPDLVFGLRNDVLVVVMQ